MESLLGLVLLVIVGIVIFGADVDVHAPDVNKTPQAKLKKGKYHA